MAREMASTFRPQLRRGLRIAPADQGRWQVRWDFDEVAFLTGESCARVLSWLVPELNGRRTIAELEEQAIRSGQQEDLLAVLECLSEEGFLCDADVGDRTDPELASALGLLQGETDSVVDRLKQIHVVVCGRSPLAERVAESARAQGMCHTNVVRDLESIADMISRLSDAANVLPVVIEPDWPPDVLDSVNDRALAANMPWMLLGAWNRRILVGPLFVPPHTACYECYRRRLDSHRAHLAAYQEFETWRRSQTELLALEPVLPAITELAAAWAALELFAHISGARPSRIAGRVLVYHPTESQLSFETVLRVPWCPGCSTDNSKVATR